MIVAIRVRARRNRAGSLLEWHPDDEERARELLDDHRAAITLLYRVIDRRKLSDEQVVLTMEIVEQTKRVYRVQLHDGVGRDLPLDRLQSVREAIEATVEDDRAHA